MAKGSSRYLRRFCSYFKPVLRIIFPFVVLWLAIPGWALASSHGAVDLHLLRSGVAAVADFDGDQLPDVASGTNLGRTTHGYAYRVDLDLTKNLEATSLSVFSIEPNGLEIKAVDVDGDHDLDLVISSRLLREPIGVWINDGHGNFIAGDSSRYVSAFNDTESSVNSAPRLPELVLCRERRNAPLTVRHHRVATKSNKSARPFDFTPFYKSQNCAECARFRAPPAA
jgi:hypothetical protein